jgi:hypothetical protein
MRYRGLIATAVVVCAVLVVGAASAAAKAPTANAPAASARIVLPNVLGMRMDQATRTLHARGLRVNEECSGLFGCVIKANWWICTQSPRRILTTTPQVLGLVTREIVR